MKHNIETTGAVRQAKAHMRRPPKTLEEPGEEPAKPNPQPQAAVNRRNALAGASAIFGKPLGEVLKASLQLQKQLRQLTHQVLVAQEDERGKLSHELRDEVAQTLLGVNVRLLLLKQAARSQAKGLKNEIASTQRLLVRSVLLVERLARELENRRTTPSELTAAAI
jgi:signal transduction histidine kinase